MAEKTKCIQEPPNIVFYCKSNKQKVPNHQVNERPVVLKDRLLMSVLWSFTVTVKVTFVILFIKWWRFFSLQISFLQNPYFKRQDVESFGNIGHFIKQRADNSP